MRVLAGISSSYLKNKGELEKLLQFEPEVVEFYNYKSSEIPRLRYFTRDHHVRLTLHNPVPFDRPYPLTRFCPSGPNPEELEDAVQTTCATLECAAELEALYVVVHYPTPYVRSEASIAEETIHAFFDPVCRRAESLGVDVALENLSAHPSFYLAEHYQSLRKWYPSLRFCLDLGHAHLLSSFAPLGNFIEVLSDAIVGCHVYNTTQLRYGRYGHEPLLPSAQSVEDGWIDLSEVETLLSRCGELKALILEIDESEAIDTDAARHEFLKFVKRINDQGGK